MCRGLCMDGGVCANMEVGGVGCVPTSLCVCIHLCVLCPGMQELPVFRSLRGRGQASASACAQKAARGAPMCGCPWAPFPCLLAHGGPSLPFAAWAPVVHMGHRHGTRTWHTAHNMGYGRQEQAEGQCQVGEAGAWCLSAPLASSLPARGQRLSASHKSQILPGDKILSPLFWGEKTTAAPGRPHNRVVKRRHLRARGWKPHPGAGMRNQPVSWPLGCCLSPRIQHPPQDQSHIHQDSASPQGQ